MPFSSGVVCGGPKPSLCRVFRILPWPHPKGFGLPTSRQSGFQVDCESCPSESQISNLRSQSQSFGISDLKAKPEIKKTHLQSDSTKQINKTRSTAWENKSEI
jgi:hypothetical protein